MVDEEKLRSLLDYKHIALAIGGTVVRFNHEIGNDNTWREIETYDRSIEEIAALINTIVSKLRTNKVTNIKHTP